MDSEDPFPGYQILCELSNSCKAKVYKARDLKDNRFVALKVCRSLDPIVRRRFLREVQCMASTAHPAIVTAYHVEESRGVPYLAMELAQGGRLADRLGKPWSAHQAAALMADLTSAVESLHQRGIIHRQIDATHVLLTPAGRPKLAGFGRARAVDDASIVTDMSAPQDSAVATDIFALGAILYELLTGHAPFRTKPTEGTHDIHQHEIPVPPAHFVPDVSSELATICMKCMASNPEVRYAKVEALAEDLRRFLVGSGGDASSAMKRGWRWLLGRGRQLFASSTSQPTGRPSL